MSGTGDGRLNEDPRAGTETRASTAYETLRWRAAGALERLLGRLGERVSGYVLALPDLLYLLRRAVSDRRVPVRLKGELVGSFLYLISPIDLVPEGLFGPLGLVDDALVLTRMLDALLNRLPAEVLDDHWAGDRAVLERLQGLAADGRRLFGAGIALGLRRLGRRLQARLLGTFRRPGGAARLPGGLEDG